MCASVLLLLLAALPALAGPRASPAGPGPAFAARQQTAVLARVGDTAELRCRVLRLADRAVSAATALLATVDRSRASPAGPGPAFAARQQTAVLARVGDTAELRCRVLRLADRAVSWVRSSDLQILTHAGAVFTADARVSCSDAAAVPYEAAPDEWGDLGADATPRASPARVHALRIERLRAADAGRYECQVNTEPKMSLFFNLTVVDSSAPLVSVRALGGAGGTGGVVLSAAGGAARLACEARYEAALAPDVLAALPALRVRWTHDGQTLDPQSARGGISLDTERWAGRVVSRLTLAQLRAADAGRYTCSAGGQRGEHATLELRLRGADGADGELEAMQRDQAVARVSSAHARRAPLAAWAPLLLLLFLT